MQSYQYNYAENGKGLEIGKIEADTILIKYRVSLKKRQQVHSKVCHYSGKILENGVFLKCY